MTIEHKIINFDRYFKKYCNIYGRSKLGLIGRQKKRCHARFIYLCLLGLDSTRDHSNSGVIYCQFHQLFALHFEYKKLLAFKVG